jgi:hypothetical protein
MECAPVEIVALNQRVNRRVVFSLRASAPGCANRAMRTYWLMPVRVRTHAAFNDRHPMASVSVPQPIDMLPAAKSKTFIEFLTPVY